MKKKIAELTDKERTVTLDALYTATASMKGRNAMKLFLKDLLTESERVMLGRRILIARLLLSGETYDGISERMGVGYGTIRTVQKWLSDQMPGYEDAIAGLEEEYGRREFKKKYASSMITRFKKKYPLHFLLFPDSK